MILKKFSVNINGIPSKCSADCSFQWLSSLTPIVNLIDSSNLSSISLTGTGFDSLNISNNEVFIGNTPCAVTLATSTVLYCTPGNFIILKIVLKYLNVKLYFFEAKDQLEHIISV